MSATQLYAPYGAARYTSGTLPTDYTFTHQRADATSGLDYCGARYYDPVAGQFSSADTTLAGGLNRYGYVGGNPESRTDPSGHRYTCPTGGCGAAGSSGSSDSSGPAGGGGTGGGTGTGSPGGSGGLVDNRGTNQDGNCLGFKHCAIFMTGVDISVPKTYAALIRDMQQWIRWTSDLERNSHNAYGFIFLEAKDATDGASQLHAYLDQLADDGYKGALSVIGHSNGAAGLFAYFAQLEQGQNKGDAPISKFVSIDAPVAFSGVLAAMSGNPIAMAAGEGGVGAVGIWAQWSYLNLPPAEQYIASHHISGVWAFDTLDPASGPAIGPWQNYAVTAGNPLNAQETHLWLTENPDAFLEGSV